MHFSSRKLLFAGWNPPLSGGSDSRQHVRDDGELQTAICWSASTADSVIDEDMCSLPLAWGLNQWSVLDLCHSRFSCSMFISFCEAFFYHLKTLIYYLRVRNAIGTTWMCPWESVKHGCLSASSWKWASLRPVLYIIYTHSLLIYYSSSSSETKF